VEAVFLIEILIGVAVTVLGLFTLQGLIVHYPIFPVQFLDSDDQDDSDAE
jgi:hypothetical protein